MAANNHVSSFNSGQNLALKSDRFQVRGALRFAAKRTADEFAAISGRLGHSNNA
jgi:hypothetical protein